MRIRSLTLLGALLTVACGQEAADPPAASAPAQSAPAAPATPAAPLFERRAAPAGAVAYIIEPADGAVVSSPVRVVFGLRGIGVSPAAIERADAGHHHLLVDTGLPDLSRPIPADDNHRHFGGGQTETTLELAAGTHTLQLLLGDHLHVPHDPPIASERITIEVR